mmetsp:Transcript_29681/g.45483  ORF Transcript_29681/g.45483 Transcript_29681/m.45483 type:complete len:206 (-) Transcript_29681:982-1599(-)
MATVAVVWTSSTATWIGIIAEPAKKPVKLVGITFGSQPQKQNDPVAKLVGQVVPTIPQYAVQVHCVKFKTLFTANAVLQQTKHPHPHLLHPLLLSPLHRLYLQHLYPHLHPWWYQQQLFQLGIQIPLHQDVAAWTLNTVTWIGVTVETAHWLAQRVTISGLRQRPRSVPPARPAGLAVRPIRRFVVPVPCVNIAALLTASAAHQG